MKRIAGPKPETYYISGEKVLAGTSGGLPTTTQAGELREGWGPMPALSYPNEASHAQPH